MTKSEEEVKAFQQAEVVLKATVFDHVSTMNPDEAVAFAAGLIASSVELCKLVLGPNARLYLEECLTNPFGESQESVTQVLN